MSGGLDRKSRRRVRTPEFRGQSSCLAILHTDFQIAPYTGSYFHLPSQVFVETELLVVQGDQRVHLRGFAGWKQACCEANNENESCDGGKGPRVRG